MAARVLVAATLLLTGALAAGLASSAGAYPEAISWAPVGIGVPPDTNLAVVWDTSMDTRSVEDAFSLSDGVQIFRGPVFAWNHTSTQPYRSEATPLFVLNASTTYYATVLATATDASGLYPLDQDKDGVGGEVTDALAWEFTTADLTPPRVMSTVPPDGAVNVSVATDVVLEFSEPMDIASASAALSISPDADGAMSWNPQGTVVTFSSALNLRFGTLYEVTVAPTAKDLAGNALDGDGDGAGGDPHIFQFMTESDANAPRVDLVTPPNGTVGVSVSANVVVRFSEMMDRASLSDALSVTAGAMTWTSANGSLTWSGAVSEDDTFTFNPFDNLPFSATVTVSLNASIARDPAGFYLDGDGDGSSEGSPTDDVVWSFATEMTDSTPPIVLFTRPPAGATNVPETTEVAIAFAESMNRTSVEDAFSLVSAARTWTKANGTFAWSQGEDEITYTPSSNLAFATTHMIRVVGTAVDVNGNPLDGDGDGTGGEDFLAIFATRPEPDAVPPTVVNTVPGDGAEGLPRNPTIHITFDDAMIRGATQDAISMEAVESSTSVALGSFEWSAADHTVSFAPAATLGWDLLYRVSVGMGAKDDAGLRLPAPHSFSFRTEQWSGRVVGRVFEGTLPSATATVTLGNRTTQTNESGEFAFDAVGAGTYNLTITKDGYQTERRTLVLDQESAAGADGREIDLGIIQLRRPDLLSPAAVASILAAALAALVILGLLIRRRRNAVRFDELEPEEAEADR